MADNEKTIINPSEPVIDNTIWDLTNIEPGTRLADWREDGVWYLILRGPSSICAYFGVPVDHPLAGLHYDDIPLDIHGGLTFGSAGEANYSPRPEGYYWYGWDYGHYGDWAFYDSPFNDDEAHKWTIGEVKEEIALASYNIAKLVKLTERLTSKK